MTSSEQDALIAQAREALMFFRYRRLVPKAQRDLIKRHRLPKPNWYVGSAESVHTDAELQQKIDVVKARIRARIAASRAEASDDPS